VRWMVAIAVAALAVAFIYLGNISPLLSLLRRAPSSTSEAPTASLPVDASKIAPTDLPSNPPPAAAPASAPTPVAPKLASPSTGPSQIPHPTTRKTSRLMRRIFTSQLNSGLSGLRAHLEKCPGRPAHGAFGGNGTYVPGVEEVTLLMLEVEMLDGRVKIVDAPLAIPGSTSDAFAACVQQALRGRVIAVPAAAAGDRAQIAFPLDPVNLAEQ